MKDSPFDLTGRTALVTGGSKGIGHAIARGFADAGADLFLCSRTEESLVAAAESIRQATGVRVETSVADMARREDVQRVADEAVQRLGKVDILVNNAGWNITQAIDEIRDEDWEYLVELNLSNVMRLTRALVPGMKQRGWGRVIHISSIMALGSTPTRNAYSATKAALIGLCKAGAGPGFLRDHGQLYRTGPDRHGDADVDFEPAAAGSVGCADGRGTLGQARRTDRPGSAVGQRGRQLCYGHLPGGRRRCPLPCVLSIGASDHTIRRLN